MKQVKKFKSWEEASSFLQSLGMRSVIYGWHEGNGLGGSVVRLTRSTWKASWAPIEEWPR